MWTSFNLLYSFSSFANTCICILILHPELKMSWISDDDKKKQIKSFIVDEIRSMNSADLSRLANSSSSENDDSQDCNKSKNFFQDFRKSRKRNRSGNDEATDIVNRYFEEETSPIGSLHHGLKKMFRKFNTPIIFPLVLPWNVCFPWEKTFWNQNDLIWRMIILRCLCS